MIEGLYTTPNMTEEFQAKPKIVGKENNLETVRTVGTSYYLQQSSTSTREQHI
jgi:hypothetical protein